MKSFEIIDTIQITNQDFRDHPEWKKKYGVVGLIAVIAVDKDHELTFVSGCMVKIHLPDGSILCVRATLAERPWSSYGIFLPNLERDDVPINSQVELE